MNFKLNLFCNDAQERQAIEAQAEVDEARRKMDENLRALGVTTSAPAGVIYIKKNSSKYDEDEDYRERKLNAA